MVHLEKESVIHSILDTGEIPYEVKKPIFVFL